ncbi:MAG: hypothetical protein NT079_02665, partial [Candidatus Omnitrophica bacterium]|nr:hypothetical protein [Candidatus Omnitrophota bacterium]
NITFWKFFKKTLSDYEGDRLCGPDGFFAKLVKDSEAGLDQLVLKLGISELTLNNWVEGKSVPDDSTLGRFADMNLSEDESAKEELAKLFSLFAREKEIKDELAKNKPSKEISPAKPASDIRQEGKSGTEIGSILINGPGNEIVQTWQDVVAYRQRLDGRGVGFDPITQEILALNKEYYSSPEFIAKIKELDRREHYQRPLMDSISRTQFLSAELGLGIEKKWNLPMGLTELDIQRFCMIYVQHLLGEELSATELSRIEKKIRELFHALCVLNPELKNSSVDPNVSISMVPALEGI